MRGICVRVPFDHGQSLMAGENLHSRQVHQSQNHVRDRGVAKRMPQNSVGIEARRHNGTPERLPHVSRVSGNGCGRWE